MTFCLITRPHEYTAAVHATRALSKAAAIELEDVSPDEAQRYLQAASSKDRALLWERVFSQLRTSPGDPSSQNLTAVLATPLLVMLARTTYSDTPDNNPADLLDSDRFPTRAALEEHLFSAYLTTLYGPHRPSRTAARQGNESWSEAQVRRWLGYLSHLKTQDLTWWQLDANLPRPTRIIITGLVALPLGGIVGLLGYFISDYLSGTPIDGPQLTSLGLLEMGTGFIAGLASGLVNELRTARGRTGGNPERVRLRLSGWAATAPSQALRGLAAELTIGLSVGIVFSLTSWLVYGFAYDFLRGPAEFFVQAFAPSPVAQLIGTGAPAYIAAGFLLGLLVGISYASVNLLAYLFSGPADQSSAVSTWDLLVTDRTVTLFRAGTVGFVILVVNFFLVGNQYSDVQGAAGFVRQGLLYGILYGSFAALTRILVSAWGRWLVFARLWLPLTGRLPWQPRRFLDDAYDRGVLRQIGAVYQFRHARLRGHLANQPRGRRPDAP